MTSALVLSACGNGDKGAAASPAATPKPSEAAKGTAAPSDGKFVLGQKPLELSFYGNYDWYNMPVWGADAATKWIQDNLKVTVKPIPNGGKAAQKLSTMIASKELPDVIWGDRGPDVEKLREAGMLVPLDPYLDKYPNLKKWAGDATLNMLRSPDGKLYQFPNWYTQRPNGNAGYMINKKIYDELGSPKLETLDEFHNYLKLVKSKYPDVTPFEPGIQGQGIDILYSAFANDNPVTHIPNRAKPNGDKLGSIIADPVFRESLQFANKLYREKLMTQDALTQTQDQVKEKINNGKVAIYASSTGTEMGSAGTQALKAKDPSHPGYTFIWPVRKDGVDKDKVWPGHYNTLGWNVAVITKTAKDPEAIFAFWDWMTGDEGSRTLFWGPEGMYWKGTDADGSPKFTDLYFSDQKGLAKLMNDLINLQWTGNTTYIDTAKSKVEAALPEDKKNYETKWQSEVTWKTSYNWTQFVNMSPLPNTPEGIANQSVKDIFLTARAKAIQAGNEADVITIMDKAEKDAQAAGYDKVLQYQTTKWKENKQKLGVK
ncbi:extracellular solute-binding protein [Paenibacillus radicibacter]|uniref:extracellular solute-binding protein n=1 Tax=Paenibacillus radicibacter TaxID=2972488 RepID=UPI002158B5D5|nr:extracellular solute-binding protein [Paenibacillus radicibacter]